MNSLRLNWIGLFFLIGFILGVSSKSISSSLRDEKVNDFFEKLNLSGDPNDDDDVKREGNLHKSDSSYKSHSSKGYLDSGDEHSGHYDHHLDEEDIERHVVKNCREFVNKKAKNPSDCIFRSLKHNEGHLDGHLDGRAVKKEDLFDTKSFKIGRCRWDHKKSLCFCPRSQEMCYDKKLKEKCYWHEEPEFYYDYDGYKIEKEPTNGKCISNAERFYNILHKLLIKRGKKDFAIRLSYNSIPARSELPFGPHGPSVISYGTSSRHSALKNYFKLADYNGEGSYSLYGGEPSFYGGYSEPTSYGGYSEPTSYGGYSEPTPYGGYSEPTPYGGYSEPTSYAGYSEHKSYGGYSAASPYMTPYEQSYESSPKSNSYQYDDPNLYSKTENSPYGYGNPTNYQNDYGNQPNHETYNANPSQYNEHNIGYNQDYKSQPHYPPHNQQVHRSDHTYASTSQSYRVYGSPVQSGYSDFQPSTHNENYKSTRNHYVPPSYGNQNTYNNEIVSNYYDHQQPSVEYNKSPLPQNNYAPQYFQTY